MILHLKTSVVKISQEIYRMNFDYIGTNLMQIAKIKGQIQKYYFTVTLTCLNMDHILRETYKLPKAVYEKILGKMQHKNDMPTAASVCFQPYLCITI